MNNSILHQIIAFKPCKACFLAIAIVLLLIPSCRSPKNLLLEEPQDGGNGLYCRHYAYSLVYDEANEQARWVAWALEKHELKKKVRRKNNFKEDPLILSGTACDEDYRFSGYDRGHLAPAADMRWNKTTMDESFYYSNISPQLPAFNRGIWKKLERHTRDMAEKYDCIYVLAGPLCSDTCERIGENGVCIPEAFFKALLIYNDTLTEAVGFYFPHKKCRDGLDHYSISIDELEDRLQMDLFPALPNSLEKKAEKAYDPAFWLLQ